MSEFLESLDPLHRLVYEHNRSELEKKLDRILTFNREKLRSSPLLVMQYQKEFSYFLSAYQIKSFGSLEVVTGLPPSSGYSETTALAAKKAGVAMILATQFSPKKWLTRFHEVSGIPVLILPTSMANKDESYEAFEASLVAKLLEADQSRKFNERSKDHP